MAYTLMSHGYSKAEVSIKDNSLTESYNLGIDVMIQICTLICWGLRPDLVNRGG